jgi:hypothetical protein
VAQVGLRYLYPNVVRFLVAQVGLDTLVPELVLEQELVPCPTL